MTTVESGQAFDLETFPPESDGIDATAQLSGHGSLRLTVGQSQNDVSARTSSAGRLRQRSVACSSDRSVELTFSVFAMGEPQQSSVSEFNVTVH